MSETYNADDVTNAPTGAVSGPSKPETYNADDVTSDLSGATVESTETKVVQAPAKAEARKQTRANNKRPS